MLSERTSEGCWLAHRSLKGVVRADGIDELKGDTNRDTKRDASEGERGLFDLASSFVHRRVKQPKLASKQLKREGPASAC